MARCSVFVKECEKNGLRRFRLGSSKSPVGFQWVLCWYACQQNQYRDGTRKVWVHQIHRKKERYIYAEKIIRKSNINAEGCVPVFYTLHKGTR